MSGSERGFLDWVKVKTSVLSIFGIFYCKTFSTKGLRLKALFKNKIKALCLPIKKQFYSETILLQCFSFKESYFAMLELINHRCLVEAALYP